MNDDFLGHLVARETGRAAIVSPPMATPFLPPAAATSPAEPSSALTEVITRGPVDAGAPPASNAGLPGGRREPEPPARPRSDDRGRPVPPTDPPAGGHPAPRGGPDRPVR